MAEMLANRFRVIDLLGQGGMGAVYRVADVLQGDRELALKTIKVRGTLTQDLKLRFKEEFRAMAKLKHPNTIEVFDYGPLDDATQYLLMEVVPGDDLSSFLAGRPLPVEQVYPILIQLLQALGFIHSRLYVHRDIKAENIRLRPDGVVKLMDFGLMDRLGVQSDGKLTGTPGYLPPEVARGGTIGAAADLYSVGCLAYELLTGSLPFVGSVVDVVRGHIGQAPRPLEEVRPEVPAGLAAVVMRLLAKQPEDRYAQASEVIAELAGLAGVQVARQNLDQKRSYLTSSSLVCRERELGVLEGALAQVRGGSGRSVFVGAPAGVGKSRLVQELLLQAKIDGVLVLPGRCLETGMAPYEPLVQVLRALVAVSTPAETARHGAALCRLLPELRQLGVEPAPDLDGPAEKRRLHETLVAWLREVAGRQPLVVFFDDLHWVDPNSLEAFNFAIRALADAAVLCLGTFRSDETPPSNAVWRTIEEGSTEHVPLAPFDAEQVLQLVKALLRDVELGSDVARFLFEATAGNAFFLTEVLRYLIEEGLLTQQGGTWRFPAELAGLRLPTSVEDTVVRRLAQLGEEARELARVASVLGRYLPREMLLVVSGLEENAFFTHLDELVDRQFLAKDDQGYAFTHDRVREALYAGLPAGRQAQLHQRCGEYLERLQGAQEVPLSELTFHFSRGEDQVKAYEYLRKAEQQAQQAGVLAVAFAHWQRAEQVLSQIDYPDKEPLQEELLKKIGMFGIQTWPRLSVESLTKLARLVAERNAGAPVLRRAQAIVAASRRPPRVTRAYLGRGVRPARPRVAVPPPWRLDWFKRYTDALVYAVAAHGYCGQPRLGLELADHLMSLALPGSALERGCSVPQLLCRLPAGHFDRTQVDARDFLAHFRLEDAGGRPDQLLYWFAAFGSFMNVALQGDRPDPALLDEVVRVAEQYQMISLKNVYWGRYGFWTAWTGRHAETEELLAHIAQNCRRMAAPPNRVALYLRPYLLWQRGLHDEALSLCQHALRYPEVQEDGFVYQLIRLLIGQIHLALGDLDAAEAEFEQARGAAVERQLDLVLIQALIGRGQLAIARRQLPAGRLALAEAIHLASAGEARNPLHEAIARRWLGELELVAGDLDLVEREVAAARGIVTAPAQANLIEQARLLRLEGDLQVARGNLTFARTAFRQAGEICHQLGNGHERAIVSRRIEALNPGRVADAVAGGPPAAEGPVRGFADALAAVAERGADAVRAAALTTCLEALNADEAFWVGANDGAVLTGQARAADLPPTRPNPELVRQVVAAGEGLATLDVPEEVVQAASSQAGLAIPSVLLVPVVGRQGAAAVLYLVRHDLAEVYEDADLALALPLARAIADALERVDAGPEPRRTMELDLVTSRLRESLDELRVEGPLGRDSAIAVLAALGAQLRLDALTLVVGDDPAAWISTAPRSDRGSQVDLTLVSQVRQTGKPVCIIELDDLEAATGGTVTEALARSVAVSPIRDLPADAVLYCVRFDVAEPLGPEELECLEACATIVTAALQDLAGAVREA